MAEAEGSDFVRKVIFGFFAVLLIGGLALYWFWGVTYDTWNPFTRGNIGVYTIYVPLMAFGLIGLLLFRKPTTA